MTNRRLSFNEILLITGFPPWDDASLPLAMGIASDHRAKLHVVHVLPTLSSPPGCKRAERSRHSGRTSCPDHRHGRPSLELKNSARDCGEWPSGTTSIS